MSPYQGSEPLGGCLMGKRKKPVEDNPLISCLRRRAELDQRISHAIDPGTANTIDLDGVNLGLQLILDGYFNMDRRDNLPRATAEEMDRLLIKLAFAIMDEVEDGQKIEISESCGSKIYVNIHGIHLLHPEGFTHRLFSLVTTSTMTSEFRHHGLVPEDLRKILHDLRNKKKAKATA